MKVGGRNFDESKESIEQKMRGAVPESIQKYIVEVNGMAYPPKQVLAHVTGWPRQSFTTMEAQRVLKKVGLACREADAHPGGRAGWVPNTAEAAETNTDRLVALEAAVATAQEAIAGLSARVRRLEATA